MTRSMITQYTKLAKFLGNVLGADYKIVLTEVVDGVNNIIAAVNSLSCSLGTEDGISGMNQVDRSIGENEVSHCLISENGRILRCSTLSIRDEGNTLIATLCIIFDDSRYQELSKKIVNLCNDGLFGYDMANDCCDPQNIANEIPDSADALRESLAAMSEDLTNQVLSENTIPVSRLTMDEKMEIIEKLHNKGVFLFKGAVKQVAAKLECSQASVYRYLSKMEQDLENA